MNTNAKEDEYNFDELAAMLNDSDDEAIMEEASAMVADTKQDDAESSDDDIDDDELDRLAMLVESGEAEKLTTPEPVIKVEKEDQKLPEVKSEYEQPSSPPQKLQAADSDSSDDEEARAMKVLANDEEFKLLKEEVKKMKARITELELKKLRAQLQALEAEVEPSSPPSKTPSPPPRKRSGSPTSKPSASLSSKIAASLSSKTSSTVKPETQKKVLDTKINSPKSSAMLDKGRAVTNLSSPKGSVRPEKGVTGGSRPAVATPNRNGATPNRNGATPNKNGAPPNRNSAPPNRNGATPNRNGATPNRPGSSEKAKSTAAPRIIKDLEVDLFGAESSSLESPASKIVKAATQNGKPSLHNVKPASPARKPPSTSQRDASGRNERTPGVEDEYDWDLEGEGGSHLSAEGKEMDKLLKVQTNRGQRTAHEASYDMNTLNNRKATWGSKPPTSATWRAASSSAITQQMKKQEEDLNVTRDPFSGIRIVDPLVSSTQMKMRMENRQIVKLSSIHQKAKASLEGDWVTIGVLVYKSDPKTSQKGNAFSIWTLTDLHDCNHPVKMFLFGETHKAHWKSSIGVVVGILNPSLMQNNDKYQKKTDEVCITADHPQKLMLMGKSKDLAFCKGTTKAGKKCIQFINKSQGEYCQFHVQKAYKSVSAKRAELQSGHTGSTPKSFEQRIMGKGRNKDQFFYGGKSFSTGVATKPDKKASLHSLVHHDARAQGKVTTLALHPLLAEDTIKLKQAETAKLARLESEKNKAFHDMLTTPTVGAVNLVKHLAKLESSPEKHVQEKKPIQHIRAKDLLTQHARDMNQRRLEHKQKQEQRQRGSSGPMIDLDEPVSPAARPANPLQCVPKLGRGFSAGPLSAKNTNHAALDKIKAAYLIQNRGGIKKEDPNAIRKKSTDDSRENIKKRLAENTEKTESSSSGGDEPPKKKSRLLGGLDLDDPEVRKLLKSKSKHAHKLTEMEEEKQAAYFDILEKKEAMEEKMASINKIKAKAVTCRNCKYSALSAKPECKQQGHNLVWYDSYKRFFSCKDCKRRTISIDRLPSHPCQGCGSNHWEKAAMMKEKKGPLLPSEELQLRGEERKYVNC